MTSIPESPKNKLQRKQTTFQKGTLYDTLKYLVGNVSEATRINFLAYYKRFCTASELGKILETLLSDAVEQHECVGKFVSTWLENYFERDFCKQSQRNKRKVRKNLVEQILRICSLLSKKGYLEDESQRSSKKISEDDELATSLTKGKFSDFQPKILAEQFTLLEHSFFKNIDVREFYGKGWSKDSKLVDAPNITRMIRRFNKVSLWVATLILLQKTSERRIKIFERLIYLATYCKELNNYNTVLEILAGVNMWVARRVLKGYQARKSIFLTKYKKIKKKFLLMLGYLRNLMDAKGNYGTYRAVIRQRLSKAPKEPTLPYLGVFLRDLTFVEDGVVDFSEDKLINFEKVLSVGEILYTIKSFQDTSYSQLKPNPIIQNYLLNLTCYQEEKLDFLSNAIKPLPEGLGHNLSDESLTVANSGAEDEGPTVLSDGSVGSEDFDELESGGSDFEIDKPLD